MQILHGTVYRPYFGSAKVDTKNSKISDAAMTPIKKPNKLNASVHLHYGKCVMTNN